jgi:hypothetical protein
MSEQVDRIQTYHIKTDAWRSTSASSVPAATVNIELEQASDIRLIWLPVSPLAGMRNVILNWRCPYPRAA